MWVKTYKDTLINLEHTSIIAKLRKKESYPVLPASFTITAWEVGDSDLEYTLYESKNEEKRDRVYEELIKHITFESTLFDIPRYIKETK